MSVYLFLLFGCSLCIIVTRFLGYLGNILLHLCHEHLLPLHALSHLLSSGLILLVKQPIVLPHGMRILLQLNRTLLLPPTLILVVVFEYLSHLHFLLPLLALVLLLLALHFGHDLGNKGRFLILPALGCLALQLAFVLELFVPIPLFLEQLSPPLFNSGLLTVLPVVQLQHKVFVVPRVLICLHVALHPLLTHLSIQVVPKLALQGQHALLLPQGVLFVEVRCVLVQPGPIVAASFWSLQDTFASYRCQASTTATKDTVVRDAGLRRCFYIPL
mmetsp:Transcript_56821/g.133455  ORF Transcript_56821/g.133455 Transcript_56821/m.133455 type:complete len:273 (-) Transcript_56821:377-1195(-)